jgi:outer membrane immunogenic protein
MKKFLIAATALSGVLAFAGSASAADLAVPVDPVYDWSGFYVGATAGYGWGESNHTDTVGTTSGDFDIEGFVGGATLGGNWQSGSFVFGIEGDISYSDIDGDSSNPICGAGGCSTDIDWLGTLRGRGGFAFDQLLIFAAGGLAVGDVSADCCGGFSESDTRVGWTIGGGAEWAISEALSVKAEYLYVDLGSVTIPTPFPVDAEAEKTHIVRMGVNFHF